MASLGEGDSNVSKLDALALHCVGDICCKKLGTVLTYYFFSHVALSLGAVHVVASCLWQIALKGTYPPLQQYRKPRAQNQEHFKHFATESGGFNLLCYNFHWGWWSGALLLCRNTPSVKLELGRQGVRQIENLIRKYNARSGQT